MRPAEKVAPNLPSESQRPTTAAMEVLVFEKAREVDTELAAEDELLKKKRRVSFAQTQTIHFYPLKDDIDTPPLLNLDPLGNNADYISPVSASRRATPRGPSERRRASPSVSAGLPLHETSMDLSHFTSDMDTGHGSWAADEEVSGRSGSFDGLDDGSGCFVHLRRLSRLEDDDSIVNEVFNDDMTMDATMFSRNLSQYFKSTTFELEGTGFSGQNAKVLIDEEPQSEDSMALTKTGAPHWGICNRLDVSIHPDDDKSDMSLATISDRVRPKCIGVDDEKGAVIVEKLSGGVTPNSSHRDGSKMVKAKPKKGRHFRAENKPSPSVQGKHSFLQKNTFLSSQGKENVAPYNFNSDDDKSDMSLGTISDRGRPENVRVGNDKSALSLESLSGGPTPISIHGDASKVVKLKPKRRQLCLTENKRSPFIQAEHSLLQKSTCFSNREKENVSDHNFQDDSEMDQKITSYNEDNQSDEECTFQFSSTNLKTLRDYLEFSCIGQLQVEWLSEHVEEVELKLHDAKKKNVEAKNCNTSAKLEKCTRGSSNISKTKLALNKQSSLAKKKWILWKIDAQRKILSCLQESKDNLMKEVAEAETKRKQVLQLKESYCLISPKTEREEASLDYNETAASLPVTNKVAELSRLYKEASEQASQLQIKWDEVCSKIQQIKAQYNKKVQLENDKSSFANGLKALITKLVFINSLLQQSQAMQHKVESNAGNNIIDLCFGELYLQSFKFNNHSDAPQIQISRSFVAEEVERVQNHTVS